MNIFGYFLLILGVVFFGFELRGLIRDIRRRRQEKKEKTEENPK